MSDFYIGVDIGGTKISAGLVEENGYILTQRKQPTPKNAKPKEVFAVLLELLEDIIAQQKVSRNMIRGIGLGVPGIIDASGKEILVTPNINLAKFPLAKELEKKYKTKVLLGNDVNVGLLGEQWLGAAKRARDVVGIFPGTGIGGAIIINNQLVTGATGAAAEIGHMMIDFDGPMCSCGNSGCFEAFAGRWAIERDIKHAIENGARSVVTEILDGDLSAIKSKVIKESLKRKDPVVTDVMTKVSRVIGKSCISIKHILNPELIILGGGVIEGCGFFILPIVRDVVNADPFFASLDECKILESKLGDDAIILGGVALVRGEAVLSKGIQDGFYPQIKIIKGEGILINKQVYKKSFYVRADGKVRKVNAKRGYQNFMQSNQIGKEELQKFCKKNPELLIIGTSQKQNILTDEGCEFLKTLAIEHKVVSPRAAIKLYNKSAQRKAVLICQSN